TGIKDNSDPVGRDGWASSLVEGQDKVSCCERRPSTGGVLPPQEGLGVFALAHFLVLLGCHSSGCSGLVATDATGESGAGFASFWDRLIERARAMARW